MSPNFPSVSQLYAPTLKALESLGGSASIDEIDDETAKVMALPDAIRNISHKHGPQTEFEYRNAWARTRLKNAGFVENSDRGVWALTSDGRKLLASDPTSIPQIVNKARVSSRKADPNVEVESLSEEASPGDWREILLDLLLSISPAAFERLCQRILRESGFTKVEVTGRSGDGGIDGTGVLRVNLLSFHVLFQSKRWKGSVGSSVVRDFRGAMVGRTDKGLIITTGTFSAEARREATRDGAPAIDLVDGDALCELLKDRGIGVRIKMVEEVTVDEDALKAF